MTREMTSNMRMAAEGVDTVSGNMTNIANATSAVSVSTERVNVASQSIAA